MGEYQDEKYINIQQNQMQIIPSNIHLLIKFDAASLALTLFLKNLALQLEIVFEINLNDGIGMDQRGVLVHIVH